MKKKKFPGILSVFFEIDLLFEVGQLVTLRREKKILLTLKNEFWKNAIGEKKIFETKFSFCNEQ